MDAKQEEPDQWDRAHVYKRLTGFGHMLTNLAGEYKSQYEVIAGLRKEIAELRDGRAADAVKIGELAAQVDTMAKWLKEKHAKEKNGNGVTK